MNACPHCNGSLVGEPRDDRPGEHYSLAVLVEIQGVYDGALFYSCPHCRYAWHRFEEGHDLHKRAQPYINLQIMMLDLFEDPK